MDSKKLKILIAVIAVTLIALLASFNSFKSQSDFGLTAEEFRDAYNNSSFDNSKIIYAKKEDSKYLLTYRLGVDNGVRIYVSLDELNNKITDFRITFYVTAKDDNGEDPIIAVENTLKKVLYCTSKFNILEFDEIHKFLNNKEDIDFYQTKTGIGITVTKNIKMILNEIAYTVDVVLFKEPL